MTGSISMNHLNGCKVGSLQVTAGVHHFVDRHRRQDNAVGSNVVVIDFDGDTTLGRFWQMQTARDWCAATYTSSSHRAVPPLPCHLPFLLSSCRQQLSTRVLTGLSSTDCLLTLASSLSKTTAVKRERLWYSNTNAEWQFNAAQKFLTSCSMTLTTKKRLILFSAEVTDQDVNRCRAASA